MKVKELFTMIENANKLNELLGNKTMHITITENNLFNSPQFHTFKEFQKWLNNEINDNAHPLYLNMEFTQNTDYRYKNYFKGEYTWENETTTIELDIYND